MPLNFSQLFPPKTLSDAFATPTMIYQTVKSPSTAVLRNGMVRLSNNATTAFAVTLHAVPNGASADASNICFPGGAVQGNDYLDVPFPQLAPGDSLQGYSSTGGRIVVTAIDGVLML